MIVRVIIIIIIYFYRSKSGKGLSTLRCAYELNIISKATIKYATDNETFNRNTVHIYYIHSKNMECCLIIYIYGKYFQHKWIFTDLCNAALSHMWRISAGSKLYWIKSHNKKERPPTYFVFTLGMQRIWVSVDERDIVSDNTLILDRTDCGEESQRSRHGT